MIAECNSYWQNITCTGRMTYIGRTWFILAEFNFYWQNMTSIGRTMMLIVELCALLEKREHDLYWLIVTLAGRIWLILAEYDLYWLTVTLTGRICSQSKVFCRSALLCRFNIPYTRSLASYLWSQHLTTGVIRAGEVPSACSDLVHSVITLTNAS